MAGGGSDARIHSLNEAYRVLGDPGRRVVYDRSLRAGTRSESSVRDDERIPAGIDLDMPPPSARFPWRGLAVATIVAVIGVAAASVLSRPADPPAPDGILHPGSCVSIEANSDARETLCTGDGDVVVRVVVPAGVACPFGTEPHRDHQGQGTACLVFE